MAPSVGPCVAAHVLAYSRPTRAAVATSRSYGANTIESAYGTSRASGTSSETTAGVYTLYPVYTTPQHIGIAVISVASTAIGSAGAGAAAAAARVELVTAGGSSSLSSARSRSTQPSHTRFGVGEP